MKDVHELIEAHWMMRLRQEDPEVNPNIARQFVMPGPKGACCLFKTPALKDL
jgi:hypothetical protein